MKRLILGFVLVLAVALAAGCTAVPVVPLRPPYGVIFTEYSAPLTLNYKRTPATPAKTGVATSRYLGIPIFYPLLTFGWDGVSLEEAAKNGGINNVEYADYKLMTVLGIYSEFTITARGN